VTIWVEYSEMSTKPTPKSDPKFVRAYDRAMLRSAVVSLFWGVISERKKSGTFTLQGLAKLIGTNKAEVSRWFKGDPNWTLNTVAAIANALNVDLEIRARDRETGIVFTSAGATTDDPLDVAVKAIAKSSMRQSPFEISWSEPRDIVTRAAETNQVSKPLPARNRDSAIDAAKRSQRVAA
jgi:transcriptional regulator with XRE-family HTH domain